MKRRFPTPRVDDSRHSVLRRARAGRQEALPGLAGVEPSLRGGRRYRVQEVTVKSALTHCRMFTSPRRRRARLTSLGAGNEPWSLNPYMGCSHDCTYCYVPDVAHVERERWGRYVVVKRNLPTVLARELKRKEPREVFLSSATDPYQPVEGAARITRRCLEILLQSGWPVRILTRNPLVLRDLDLLRRFDDLEVGMSVPTLDEAARRVVEPGAPPIAARLKALRRLAHAGLEPYVNLAPCYPLSGGVRPDDIAAAFAAQRVSSVHFGAWRYLSGVRPALAARVLGSSYEIFSRAVEDPAYMDRLHRALAGAFRRAGVPFSAMGRTRDPDADAEHGARSAPDLTPAALAPSRGPPRHRPELAGSAPGTLVLST